METVDVDASRTTTRSGELVRPSEQFYLTPGDVAKIIGCTERQARFMMEGGEVVSRNEGKKDEVHLRTNHQRIKEMYVEYPWLKPGEGL